MLTIFSIPKDFEGYIGTNQRNAIQSWKLLHSDVEIILFGDTKGLASTAAEFGVRHISNVRKSEFGTPFLDSAFSLAQESAKNDILVYLNSDIILVSDFIPALKTIKFPLFLMTGRRWNVDLKGEIKFSEKEWETKLRGQLAQKGELSRPSCLDYFVFPRSFPHNLPSFIVGRPCWDNWFLFRACSLNIPVIDATKAITAVHQNHKSAFQRIKEDYSKKVEAKHNLSLTSGLLNLMTLRDADWVLGPGGLERPKFPRRIFSKLSLFYPWRLLLRLRRKLKRIF